MTATNEIKVPKPPAKAFNPQRPASDLLRQQIRHLEWAVRHAGERRGDFNNKVKDVKTEADAARRVQQLLPRLESADRLPFDAAFLQEAAAIKAAKYSAPKKATKPRAKSRKRARKAKPATRAKRATAKR